MTNLTFVILFLVLHSEVFQLDTVSTNSVDTITIGATFKGGNETNSMFVLTGKRLIRIEIISSEAMRASNLTDGASGVADRRLVQSNFDAPVGQGHGFDSHTIQSTNDAPVRQWHGALMAPLPPPMPASSNSVHRVTQMAQPVPQLPPKPLLVERSMKKFYDQGGMKERPVPNSMVPTPKWEGKKP